MKAVIYARYSSDNQREESIEGQLRECKEYAEKNGITILRSYIDRALSAKTDNRPEFQNMVQDSAKGCLILCWFGSWIGLPATVTTAPTTRRCSGEMASRWYPPRRISLMGRRALFWNPCWKEWRNIIQRNWRRKSTGAYGKCAERENNGGGIPLGYQLTDDQHLRIDPLTAPVVREIYQRYAEGETVRSIITSLNERHILTQKQKPFRPNSLHSVLCNRKYIGEYRYKDIVIPDGVPSIIPRICLKGCR